MSSFDIWKFANWFDKRLLRISFSHRLFPALNLGSFLALTFPQHWVGPAPQDSYRCHLYRCHLTCIGDTRFLSVPLDWLVPGWCLFLLDFWEQLIDGRPQVVQRRCLTQNIIQRGHEHRSYTGHTAKVPDAEFGDYAYREGGLHWRGHNGSRTSIFASFTLFLKCWVKTFESDSTVCNLTCKMMPAVPTMTAIEKIHKKSLKKFGVTFTSILMIISYYFVNLK